MAGPPEFPQFKPIQLEDRDSIRERLNSYQPQTSEWTFTNLFIWRSHYGFQWSIYQDWLLVICKNDSGVVCGLQPIGPSSRLDVVRMLLQWLKEERGEVDPQIVRADQRLVLEIKDASDLLIEPTRDHFDYVYRTEDLIKLAGRKYHSKKNHLNRFMRDQSFSYDSLKQDHLEACLKLVETWCQWHRCEEDMNLLNEWEAVRQALNHFDNLKIEGGVILIQDKVEAFTLGELLNDQIAVIHVEKANPEIPGLYAAINQQFCERSWQKVTYINREQDLGEPGLRKAKLSYHPERLVEKFRIILNVNR
jgi:hypothetical protein